MTRTKVGGRTRTAIEEAAILHKEDMVQAGRFCRQERERIDYSFVPRHVAERYEKLSRRRLIETAKAACEFAPGTAERFVVYMLRYAFDMTFIVNDEETYLFNPLDDNESELGTPLYRKAEVSE